MKTAFVFFGGLADLFLSLMLWFILDSEKAASVLVDGDRVYVVQDFIRQSFSDINETEDCEEEDDEDEIPTQDVR